MGMKGKLRSLFQPRWRRGMDWPEPPPGKKLWDPPGGIEVYVHSGLSEAYGVDETVGMDKVLSEDNIRRARACREIGDQIEQGLIDEKEGYRKIGEWLVSRNNFFTSEEELAERGISMADLVKIAERRDDLVNGDDGPTNGNDDEYSIDELEW